MATLEDEKTRRPDSQDERNRKERESVTETDLESVAKGRAEQKRPVEDKTAGSAPGVSSGKR